MHKTKSSGQGIDLDISVWEVWSDTFSNSEIACDDDERRVDNVSSSVFFVSIESLWVAEFFEMIDSQAMHPSDIQIIDEDDFVRFKRSIPAKPVAITAFLVVAWIKVFNDRSFPNSGRPIYPEMTIMFHTLVTGRCLSEIKSFKSRTIAYPVCWI